MSRVLSLHRTVVTPGDRARFLERAKAREVHYTAAGCRFWVFEEAALPGAFIEFVEASDAATLKGAHATAVEPPFDAARLYAAVDLG